MLLRFCNIWLCISFHKVNALSRRKSKRKNCLSIFIGDSKIAASNNVHSNEGVGTGLKILFRHTMPCKTHTVWKHDINEINFAIMRSVSVMYPRHPNGF